MNKGLIPAKHMPDILGDGISYLEHYDFSEANMNDENRLRAITGVASVCYQSSKSFGSESLYNRLLAEAGGLPSSSFEFVPILLTKQEVDISKDLVNEYLLSSDEMMPPQGFQLNIEKYGEWILDGQYLLTNFRCAVYDKEVYGSNCDYTERYNTKEECTIIKDNFYVFCAKTDLPTFGQMVRHRANWQVLSRRYVSGERVAFEFYVEDRMKNVKSYIQPKEIRFDDGSEGSVYEPKTYIRTTHNVIDGCVEHYRAALKDGIKPQVARGIIPQCAYTLAWCAFQPSQMANFFKMRCDSHAQWETQQFAYKMKESIEEGFMEIKLDPEREEELYRRLESYQKNGAADLISTEEMITLLKAADEREICENCIHGEQCYVEEDKQHCNIYDKSFEKNHSCDSVEVDKTK